MDNDEINPRKECEMCGELFISRVGEPYCESCSQEFEEETDRQEIARIVGDRGGEWVVEAVQNGYEKKIKVPFTFKKSYWEAVRDMAKKVGNIEICEQAEANIKALQRV